MQSLRGVKLMPIVCTFRRLIAGLQRTAAHGRAGYTGQSDYLWMHLDLRQILICSDSAAAIGPQHSLL